MKQRNFSGLCGILSSFFIFSLVVIIWALLVVIITPAEAWDPTLPADNTKIASAPAMIRANELSIVNDGIVNAGRLASYTPVEVMGELFTCVASTTSTVMLNSSGTNLLLGSATGTHKLICLASIDGDATGSANVFAAEYSFSVRVATTTEIFVSSAIITTDNQSLNMGIATSSTRGEIIFTASGNPGPTWTNHVWRNK